MEAITPQNVMMFLLLVTRLGGLFLVSPILNPAGTPAPVKVWLVVFIALILYPLHFQAANTAVASDLIVFGLAAVSEFLIGAIMGFCVFLVFSGVQLAGEFVSLQMGLNSASTMDPTTHVHTPVMSQFYFYAVALLFLDLNVHHAVIKALDHSIQVLPLGVSLSGVPLVTEKVIWVSSQIFVLGLMLAIPVFGVLILIDISLAFMSKVMPQVQVFILSLPVKICVGLVLLSTSLPMVDSYTTVTLANMVGVLTKLYVGEGGQ